MHGIAIQGARSGFVSSILETKARDRRASQQSPEGSVGTIDGVQWLAQLTDLARSKGFVVKPYELRQGSGRTFGMSCQVLFFDPEGSKVGSGSAVP